MCKRHNVLLDCFLKTRGSFSKCQRRQRHNDVRYRQHINPLLLHYSVLSFHYNTMIFCRIRLSVFLLLSLAYTTTAAAASVSSVDTSTLKSLGLSRKEIKEARAQEPLEDENDEVYVEEDVDEEEEPWKTTNEDWWKDPFSVFSDDEQEEEIDESVGIIEEAESLGEDISMDEPVEEEEEEESEQQQQQQEEEEEEEKEALEEEVLEEELAVPDDDEAPPAPVKKVSPKVATPESPTATTTTNTTIEKPVVPKKKTQVKTTPAQPTADTEPKQVATAEITSSTPGPIFASPLALLVPFFPKIQNALSNVSGGLSQVPLASLAASAVIAKFCIDTVKKKNNDKKVIEHLNKNSAIQEDDASEPEESVDEILAKERNDIGEQASTEDSPSSRKAPLNDFLSRRPRLPWVQGVRDKLARTSAGQRLPSARELYAQVETLKQQLSKTEFERDSMEKEYEKASFKVRLFSFT